jgi:hypothetical protein
MTVAGDFCYKVEARSHGNAKHYCWWQGALRGPVEASKRSSRKFSTDLINSSRRTEGAEADSRATGAVKEAVLSCCNLCLYSIVIVTRHGCNLQL